MNNIDNEEKLCSLIENRLLPDADKKSIDNSIWEAFGQEVCVMFTDLSGFSRMVEKFGIIHFLQTIYESKRILFPIIKDNNGIVLKVEGDSFLVIFKNTHDALKSSINMQKTLKTYNETKSDEEKVLLCIGLGFGKVLKVSDHEIYGAEVNAASKLGEDTAKAWEILVTENFKEKHIPDTYNDYIEFEYIPVIPPGSTGAYKVIYYI